MGSVKPAFRADLDGGAEPGRGRHGLSCETVLRCAVWLHVRQTSYRGLAFELADSLSARRFARLDPSRPAPGKSALQACIGSIGAGTWERIGRGLLEPARRALRRRAEAGISYLKRCFGLGRCLWRGLERFKAYVHSAVFAHNLMRLVRFHPKPA